MRPMTLKIIMGIIVAAAYFTVLFDELFDMGPGGSPPSPPSLSPVDVGPWFSLELKGESIVVGDGLVSGYGVVE